MGIYDLRNEGIRFVKKKYGEEYVQEFCEMYDKISSGVPIGGFYETVVFITLIEDIKKDHIQKGDSYERTENHEIPISQIDIAGCCISSSLGHDRGLGYFIPPKIR